MHGLGNDFVIFDAGTDGLALTAEAVRRIADRRRGIGCDQVLVLATTDAEPATGRYRVYNASGEEAEQCGNGARCLAALLAQRAPADVGEFVLHSPAGQVEARVHADGLISVCMPEPQFLPARIPFEAVQRQSSYTIETAAGTLTMSVVSMGNPHAVMMVDDVDEVPVAELGGVIERHPSFPQGVNVGFAQVLNRGRLRLRVHERGVGETRACGTGACAATAIARDLDLVDQQVEVDMPGGLLTVTWPGPGQPVWLTGPAARVFEGSIDL